jgi:hypothetical protein
MARKKFYIESQRLTRRKALSLVYKFVDSMEEMGFDVYDEAFPLLLKQLKRAARSVKKSERPLWTNIHVLWQAADDAYARAVGRA